MKGLCSILKFLRREIPFGSWFYTEKSNLGCVNGSFVLKCSVLRNHFLFNTKELKTLMI